jgi:phosphate transport system protein
LRAETEYHAWNWELHMPLRSEEQPMARQTFERALRELEDDLLVLGSMVESALVGSVAALKQRELETSKRIFADDRLVNERRFAIEDKTLTLIATQQPLAGDLRLLAAVLEIVTELERIGDYAKGIAKIHILMGSQPLIKPLVDIPIMADKVRAMLHHSLDAFVRRDVEMARAVAKSDDEVDALYNQVYKDLMVLMAQSGANLDQVNYLLWVAHNLERAGDRVTNICERVIFTVTGKMMELDTHFSVTGVPEV